MPSSLPHFMIPISLSATEWLLGTTPTVKYEYFYVMVAMSDNCIHYSSLIPQNFLSGHQKWACAYSTKYSSRLVVRTEQLFWSMVYCWYVSTDGQFSDCKLILAVWTELGTD